MTDRILVRDLQVVARHGVLREEATLGQRFVLDITAELDLRRAGRTDDVADTISYADLIRVAVATLTERRFYLLEAAAEAVADDLLSTFPKLDSVALELRKPGAPIDAIFGHVAVAIHRSRRPDDG
ncbi:dihydroneopterin aldolase [Enterovirga sp. CN4-39]|uniref:dihydroneopterin aldolase n=1 Tax=Enterovirga sp. CN4-39 TaxID=3400910 RepID=UPI003C072E52